VTSEIEDFAGAVFALQDMVDNEDLDNVPILKWKADILMKPARGISTQRSLRRRARREEGPFLSSQRVVV